MIPNSSMLLKVSLTDEFVQKVAPFASIDTLTTFGKSFKMLNEQGIYLTGGIKNQRKMIDSSLPLAAQPKKYLPAKVVHWKDEAKFGLGVKPASISHDPNSSQQSKLQHPPAKSQKLLSDPILIQEEGFFKYLPPTEIGPKIVSKDVLLKKFTANPSTDMSKYFKN